jgi:hypothetical protein
MRRQKQKIIKTESYANFGCDVVDSRKGVGDLARLVSQQSRGLYQSQNCFV